MKKLIAQLVLIMLITTAQLTADSITSGPMGLLKPSTNTADPNRSWADKLNSNFDIIAATMAQALASGVSQATTTLGLRLDAVAKDTTTILNRPAVINIYDEAVRQGDATTLNFVGTNVQATNSGSTTTVTISGGSGGGSPKFYQVTVGTPGMPNVDYNIAVSSDLWAPLTALGANGLYGNLFTATTVYGRILFVGNGFNIQNATKPAGITFACMSQSSACWLPLGGVDGTSQTIITVYGDRRTVDLENFSIDASSIPGWTGKKVVISSNVIINGLSQYNFGKPSKLAVAGVKALSVTLATYVVINDYYIDTWAGRTDQVVTWDGAAIDVDITTYVFFNRPHLGRWTTTGTTIAGWYFARSVGWQINDLLADNAQAAMIVIDGSNLDFQIKGGNVHVNGAYAGPGGGIITGCAQNYADTSTGTITGVNFYHETGGSNQPIIDLATCGGAISGVTLSFNNFFNRSGGTPTGIQVSNTTLNTFRLYNRYYGMGPGTDAGVGSRIIE